VALALLFAFRGALTSAAPVVALRRPHWRWNNRKQRAGSLTPA
jgi:hypothetical protein